MQTPSGEWAGSEPPLLELAAGLGLVVGWAAAFCAAWAAWAAWAAFSAAFFWAIRTAARRARYVRRMVRALSRTIRAATSWCESIIMSSLVRLGAALVSEIVPC